MFVPESRNKIETYDLFLYQHKWLAWRRIFSFLGKMNYFGALFFTSLTFQIHLEFRQIQANSQSLLTVMVVHQLTPWQDFLYLGGEFLNSVIFGRRDSYGKIRYKTEIRL